MTFRYVVHTFGCQMNVHDSDRMAGVLAGAGGVAVASVDDADVVIFNTCSVREKAEQKLRSEVGKLAPLRRARPDLVVAVAGCVAQQEGEALLARIRHVDLVVGPDNVEELPALLVDQFGGAPPVARTAFDTAAPRFLSASPEPGRAPVTALVTTMKGCDERCSFCIVPYTRGPERYRPARDVVDEVRRFVRAGSREVLLLGQTVDSFRDPELPPPTATTRTRASSRTCSASSPARSRSSRASATRARTRATPRRRSRTPTPSSTSSRGTSTCPFNPGATASCAG